MEGPNEWTVTGTLRGWDVRNRLDEIDVPTLVIRGRHDMSTDPISATLVNGIKGAREVVLENSSHTPVLEETNEYLEAITTFMREAEAKWIADAAGHPTRPLPYGSKPIAGKSSWPQRGRISQRSGGGRIRTSVG